MLRRKLCLMTGRFMPWEKAGPCSSSNFRRHSVLIRFNDWATRKGEKGSVHARPVLALSRWVLPLMPGSSEAGLVGHAAPPSPCNIELKSRNKCLCF